MTIAVAGRKGLRRSLLVLVWLCVGVCGVSSQEECLGLFDIYDQGVYVCRDHPDLVTALQIAEKMAREECQEAFHRERWNCSGFSLLNPPNITNRVTKEAAYVHALSLAAIAHSVAKVCALGDATSCTCEDEGLDLPESGGSTEYEMGCSDNVGFGINFAVRFLLRGRATVAENSNKDVELNVMFHNLMTAAHVVKERTVGTTKPCKCLGISGSCVLQSCPQEFPEFATLGKDILNVYRNHTCHEGSDSLSQSSGDDPTIGSDTPDIVLSATQEVCSDEESRQLLFLNDSPNYCIRNEAIGSLGTSGRECDPHTTGSDSCDYLCTQCGRGHVKVTRVHYETCYCKFTFCCDIHCFKCPRTTDMYVCS